MMKEAFKLKNLTILILSIIGLYLLAPSLDRSNGLFVSFAYAMILIVSSKVVFTRKNILKYVAFLVIDLITYYMLYNDQPWDFLFHTGIWSGSAVPLIGCSIIMAFAGWLLIERWSDRWLYTIITLGLQIPIGLFVGGDAIQDLFGSIAQWIRFKEHYPVALQVWQFEWMLTYYLPIYFFAHRRKKE